MNKVLQYLHKSHAASRPNDQIACKYLQLLNWVIPFIIRTPPMDERIPTGQILGLRGFLLVRYWELADSFGPIPTGQILPSRCSILYCQIFIMKIIIVPFIILTPPPPRLTLGISRFLPVRYWQLADSYR